MALQKPESGKMEDPIDPLESGIQYIRLENIAPSFEYFHSWIPKGIRQIFHPAPNEIVVDHYFGHVFSQEPVNGVRTDQAATTDNNKAFILNIHGIFPSNLFDLQTGFGMR